MSKLIWIDTTSGTWGRVQDSNGSLVLVDTTDWEMDDTEVLGGATDAEIAQLGLEEGRRAVPAPTQEQFNAAAAIVREAMTAGAEDRVFSPNGATVEIMRALGLL